MVVNYLIIFLLFPLAMLVKSRPQKREELQTVCDKYDSTMIRGIAAWMIVFAHYIVYLEDNGATLGLIKNIYAFGSMGVGVFFFLSGYGIYISGSKENRLDFKWIVRRIKTLIIPYLVIQTIEYFVLQYPHYSYRIYEYWLGIQMLRWYIIASLILYFGWFLVFNFCRRKLIWMFMWEVGVVFVFLFLNFEDYWYATIMLFFLGMLFSKYKNKILDIFMRKWMIYLFFSVLMWGGAVLLYATTKFIIFKTLISVFFVALFILVFMKIRINSKLMYMTGKMSLYIYLVHLAIIDIVVKYRVPFIYSSIYGLVLFCISTFAISWILSKGVNLITDWNNVRKAIWGKGK